MAFLKFNKAELVNLSYSLGREIVLANKTGAYCNTSIVTCNTRRYHGLLAVPVDGLGGGKYVLLSSLDESIISTGHQFNLGIHCYGDLYEPKGHKYIADFNYDKIPEITLKVGSVVMKKSLLLDPSADRVMIRYELVEAAGPITLELKPFLAFRNIHSLTAENSDARTWYRDVENGVVFNMYDGFPDLNLQTSVASEFKSAPCWYKGITYSDEYRRGFDCVEDLFAPGVFSIEMKKGDSFVFAAGVDPVKTGSLKAKFTRTLSGMKAVDNFQDLLVRNADLLKTTRNGKNQINAGFSWLETGLLRETLMSLTGLTLYANGSCEDFEAILDCLIKDEGERLYHRTTQVEAPLRLADVLQQYIDFAGDDRGVWKKYGAVMKGVIDSYAPGVRKEVTLHPNGLLWAQMDRVALSWMNAYIDGNPVTERAGYQVETNAWWYNALCFALDMERMYGSDEEFIRRWTPVRELAFLNFEKVFYVKEWGYLADYVDNNGPHGEVRPNMMIAAYVPYSPVSDEVKSAVMNVVKYELITKRGIRTLSPRNVNYSGVYEGSQVERDLAYHQGCTRTELLGPYIDICFRIVGPSYVPRAEYHIEGFVEDINKHGVGCFSELYDGDPPHEPHGAVSSACATAALLRCEYLIAKNLGL
ncbi:MAG: amylo-alpha-1,6-glucosidase [Bacteroidales bacterium]|nr:amylo-alpha-1,6-glucosidase [Bacteroidales bacterium]